MAPDSEREKWGGKKRTFLTWRGCDGGVHREHDRRIGPGFAVVTADPVANSETDLVPAVPSTNPFVKKHTAPVESIEELCESWGFAYVLAL